MIDHCKNLFFSIGGGFRGGSDRGRGGFRGGSDRGRGGFRGGNRGGNFGDGGGYRGRGGGGGRFNRGNDRGRGGGGFSRGNDRGRGGSRGGGNFGEIKREFMADSIYVGQLPSDIKENDLKKLFPKANNVTLTPAEGTRPG